MATRKPARHNVDVTKLQDCCSAATPFGRAAMHDPLTRNRTTTGNKAPDLLH